MTKKFRNLIYGALTVTLAAGMLTGCSSSDKPEPTPEEGSSEVVEVDDETNEDGKLFDETLEFSYMGNIWGDHPQDGNAIFDEMMERTNTDIDFQWFPAANYAEKVGVTLASGKLPDMIYGGDIATLVDEAAIIPLDDLLEEHGQNILKAIGEEDLKYMRHAGDGRIYFIPTILDYPPAYSMQIREDWLDNVGIDEVPEDWDEWKAAWKAFKEQDANNDGDPTNDVPFSGDIYSLMPAFGLNVADKFGFMEDEDGNYTLAYELPEFRVFLEEMRELYSEGILDTEFSTRGTFVDNVELEKAFHANIAGSSMTWAANTRTTTDILREIDENAKLIGVKPIKGPGGHQGIPQRKRVSGSAAITVAGEDKAEDIVKFFNYLFSDEGIELMSYGIEGEHHEKIDGKPVLKAPYNDGFEEARQAGLNFTPVPHVFDGDAYTQLTFAGKTEEELEETTKMFYDALLVGEDYFFVPTPLLNTQAFAEKQAVVFPKIEQLLAECVTGSISVDKFFEEYEKLKPVGLQEILDEGKEAWEYIKG
ncbi:MAG: extracellular solute-binding protein [Epulopiscium sp.]|nr:extracellular solute-binding protein [Candidatus Epulonipiscium sp.]